MAITFTQSTGGPVPSVQIEINLAGVAGVDVGEKDLYFMGEGNSGTLSDDTVSVALGSGDDAIAAAGDRSVAAFMAAHAFEFNNQADSGRVKGQVFIAQITDAGGTAAEQTLTFAVNATAAGTWVFAIGRKIFRVSVQSGDTPTIQADRFVSVYNAAVGSNRLPIAAVAAVGVVTLTASATGIHFNPIALETITDPGIATTATFSGVTMGAVGGTPGVGVHTGGNLDAILAVLLTQKTRRLVPGFNDDASLEELITHVNDKGDAVRQLGGQLVVANIDTRANLVTWATALDDGDDADRVIAVGASDDTKSWFAELAAVAAAGDSSESETARSLNDLALASLHVPDDTFDATDLQVMLENGVTPVYRPSGDDTQRISRWVMAATRFGVIDGALIDVLDVVRDRLGTRLRAVNNRASIVADDQVAYKGFVTQPKAQKGIILSEFLQYERDGLLTGVEDLFDQVQIAQPNPNTLQLAIPTAMLPQLHNTQIRLDAQIGTV